MGVVSVRPELPIAVFMTRFQPGGTERQMIELIRRLDRRRFKVHVACFHADGAWMPRVVGSAASVTAFPIHGFARPGTARQLLAFAQWCRRNRIAVVQTCDFYANIFALPAAALARVPIRIGSRRELNPDKSSSQIRLQRQAYRFATGVVANSPAARRILEQEGVAAASIAVIPNGIDVGAFANRRTRDKVRTFITVANLRPEKQHETLIAAAATLCRLYPDVSFQIVGDGPRRRSLEELAQAQGVGERIVFLGHREDIPALLAAADAFVLPSRSEAFPNSALEAMVAGLPVVASAVGGLVDLVDHGRTGLLVPPADPEALVAALRSLIEAPARAAALGGAARAHVQQGYSFERMVAAFEATYLSSLHSRTTARARHAEAPGI
jgi:L-malate glycosyltransferase